jgi:tRNA threonylcarbamoyladenosine biosynthesis protein TsaB
LPRSLLTFALDTSTHSPSLAVTRGDRLVGELWLAPEPGAGRRVLEGAHHLLAAAGIGLAEIQRIVVGVGPGGFTGLRIGLATAAGLGQALACPVVGASSLEALAAAIAETVRPGAVVVPAHDARRGELFAAAYEVGTDGSLTERIAPMAIAAADLAARLTPAQESGAEVVAAGSGALVARQLLTAAGLAIPPEASAAHRIRAAALVARVHAGAGRPPVPVYARLPDAEVNRLRASGAGV